MKIHAAPCAERSAMKSLATTVDNELLFDGYLPAIGFIAVLGFNQGLFCRFVLPEPLGATWLRLACLARVGQVAQVAQLLLSLFRVCCSWCARGGVEESSAFNWIV